MGGGGGIMGGGSRNFVTFNINIWSIRKWLPRLSGVIMGTSLSGSTRFSEVIIPYVSL